MGIVQLIIKKTNASFSAGNMKPCWIQKKDKEAERAVASKHAGSPRYRAAGVTAG